MTIFQKIGNFFSSNFKNGNIAKWTTAAGATAFTVGATGAMIHSMNHSSSCDRGIFSGMFGGCCGGGFTGGYVGGAYMGGPYMGGFIPGAGPLNDPQLQHLMYCNPLGITNTPYAQMTGYSNNFGMYNSGMYSGAYPNFSMLNQLYTQTFLPGNNNKLNPTDAAYAGDLAANQGTEAGQKLDAALDAMTDKNGNVIDGKEITFIDFGDKTSVEDRKATYKEQISEIGKSYLKNMDKNGDGIVNQEEYIAAELADAPADASAAQKEAMKNAAQTAFSKLDQNRDGKLDWKETSSMIQTFDRDVSNGKSIDGKITSDEFAHWAELMQNSDSVEFDNNVRSSYEDLFGGN